MNFATNPRILLHLPPPSEILGEREGVAGGELPKPSGIIVNSFARGLLRSKMPTARCEPRLPARWELLSVAGPRALGCPFLLQVAHLLAAWPPGLLALAVRAAGL